MTEQAWKYVDVNASPEEIEEATNMVADGTANIKFTENGKPVAVMISPAAYENIKKRTCGRKSQIVRRI